MWQEFFWRSPSRQETIPLQEEWNRKLFFLENLDISEKELTEAVAEITEKEEEIKKREKYKPSLLKIIFRAEPKIREKEEGFYLENFSFAKTGKIPVIFLNLQQFMDDGRLNSEKAVAYFVTNLGFLQVYQHWRTKDFQEMLRNLLKRYSEKETRKIIKNNFAHLGAFLWASEYLKEQLIEIVSTGLEMRKEISQRIFQRLRATRNQGKRKEIAVNLKRVLLDLVLLEKEAEISKNQELEKEITKEINWLITRSIASGTNQMPMEVQELKDSFNLAEEELSKILLSADFDYWLPDTYPLQERRKPILMNVLEKKAPELIPRVAEIKDETDWSQTITEIKGEIKITPAEIEDAEKLFIENKN